jgi:hypothetical protein
MDEVAQENVRRCELEDGAEGARDMMLRLLVYLDAVSWAKI